MLVDIDLEVKPEMKFILSVLCNGQQSEATRLDVGLYQIYHFGLEHVTKTELDAYWLDGLTDALILLPSEYGVCDSPAQLLRTSPHMKVFGEMKFCVSFTQIAKKDQPAQGGWRWHKWGPYFGDQKPMTEYIYDEPQIEVVFVYHVYEALS
jgi:hypothetical protein